jgi:hypothetical protein
MSNSELKFWVWLFVVVFVFYGDPDVWDKMHDYVMHIETCK